MMAPGLNKKRRIHHVQGEGAMSEATQLRDMFAEVTSQPHTDIPIVPLPEIDCFDPIELWEFDMILHSTKSKTSAGSDRLSYLVWKKVSEDNFIRQDLVGCLNLMLSHGEFPEAWKHTLVVPIPKPGGGWRPISLLNNLSKVVDKILSRRLAHIYGERPTQFGCTAKRSTHMAILRFLHNSAVGHVHKQIFGAIAVDFSKAYDKVPHGILIAKLQRYGIPSYYLHYIRNWLTERQ